MASIGQHQKLINRSSTTNSNYSKQPTNSNSIERSFNSGLGESNIRRTVTNNQSHFAQKTSVPNFSKQNSNQQQQDTSPMRMDYKGLQRNSNIRNDRESNVSAGPPITKQSYLSSSNNQQQMRNHQSQSTNNRQNLANKPAFESFTPQFSLESLIKQAQEKKMGKGKNQGPVEIQIAYAFNNKIDNFEGDNDNVEEEVEYESSAEKASFVDNRRGMNEGINIYQKQMKSPEENIQPKQFNEDSADYGLSSESKQNRLSFTPNYNLVSSERNGLMIEQDSGHKTNLNRIFSDLSAKVVNINNGSTILQNPFQQQKNEDQVLESALQHSQVLKYNQHSEICNYESQQPKGQISPFQPTASFPLGSNVNQFDLMKNEYLNKKSELQSKYNSSNSSQVQINSQESPEQRENEEVQEFQTKEEIRREENEQREMSNIAKKKEEIIGSVYKNQQQSRQETPFLTFDDFLNRNSTKNAYQPPPPHEAKNPKDQPSRFQQAKSPRDVIDKQELQRKEKEQEYRKKREIEMLKQKAKEKEALRLKRIQSAIVIQRWTRGYLQRIRFKKLQKNFKYMRILRRMMSVAYGKYRIKFIQQLVQIMQQINEYNQLMQDEMYQKYLEHCVLLIQKTWKGYYARRYLIQSKIQKYRMRRLLNAAVKGWKIRRILSGCREVIAVKRDLADLEHQIKSIQGFNNPVFKTIMLQRRKKIEELSKLIPNLYRNGRWIFSQQKKLTVVYNSQKKSTATLGFQSNQSNSNFNNQGYQNKQVDFPLQMTGNKSQLFNKTQKVQDTQRTNQQINFDQYQDYNPALSSRSSNLAFNQAPVVQKQPVLNLQQEKPTQQEKNPLNIIWPSQRSQVPLESADSGSVVVWPSQRPTTAKQGPEEFTERNDLAADLPFSQRTAVADKLHTLEQQTKIQPNNNPHLKSYQQTYDQEEEEYYESGSHSKRSNKRQNKQSPVKKHFLEDQYDNDENDAFYNNEADYYESRSNKQKRNHYEEEDHRPHSQMKQQNYYENEEDRPIKQQKVQNFDDLPIKPSKNINFDDLPINPAKNVHNYDFDEMPIKPSKNNNFEDMPIKQSKNVDDIPIKPLKKNPVFESDDISQNEDLPIKGKKQQRLSNAKKFNSNIDLDQYNEQEVEVPAYNFEEMLEKALQDQQNQGILPKKGAGARRSKTTRGDASEKEEINEDGASEFQGKGQNKKAAKIQNLKKRQKYDPRKAIEQAKKQQEAEKDQPKEVKSAFPEGLLNKPAEKDRVRSQTSQPQIDKEPDNSTKFKRKTQKQAEQEKTQEEPKEQESTNVSSTNNGQAPKPFLKRKTQAVQFQKVDWKVKSRIDCWTNKGGDRSNNQSQTRRKTSAMRSPKQNLPVQSAVPNTNKQEETKQPPQKKVQQTQQTPPPLAKKEQAQANMRPQPQQLANSFSQVTPQIINVLPTQYLQNAQAAKSVIKLGLPNNQTIYDDTIDNESIPDENEQYEFGLGGTTTMTGFNQLQNNMLESYSNQGLQKMNTYQHPISNQQKQWEPPSNVPFPNQMVTQMPTKSVVSTANFGNEQLYGQMNQINQMNYNQQNFTNMIDQFNHDQQTIANENMGNQNDAQTLQLEELEKVFEMFHPKMQSFEDSQIPDTHTLIPHLTMNSMFFTCYSDDIYDTILEDLREYYISLCNE